MRITSAPEIYLLKRKRWLTTTIFSPFHVIMELCLNKIIITTFLKLGNRKLTSLVGIISDIEIGAEDALKQKRAHWKIENTLHHVLDDTFREDRSSARKSRNNLVLIRKFAFDILKIACIHDDAGKGIQKMSDWFADDINLIAKYVFHGIQRIR